MHKWNDKKSYREVYIVKGYIDTNVFAAMVFYFIDLNFSKLFKNFV